MRSGAQFPGYSGAVGAEEPAFTMLLGRLDAGRWAVTAPRGQASAVDAVDVSRSRRGHAAWWHSTTGRCRRLRSLDTTSSSRRPPCPWVSKDWREVGVGSGFPELGKIRPRADCPDVRNARARRVGTDSARRGRHGCKVPNGHGADLVSRPAGRARDLERRLAAPCHARPPGSDCRPMPNEEVAIAATAMPSARQRHPTSPEP
jgi:hypothetical protein